MARFSNNARSSGSRGGVKPTIILSIMTVLLACFYAGTLTGMYAGRNNINECTESREMISGKSTHDKDAKIQALVQQRVEKELLKMRVLESRFSPQMTQIAAGTAKTKKSDFVQNFDYGNPIDGDPNKEYVLILYSGKALPSNKSLAGAAALDDGNGIPFANVEDTTENCDILDVVLTKTRERGVCLAIVNDYQSSHLQKWLRVGDDKTKLDRQFPLQHVGRGRLGNGGNAYPSPSQESVEKNWKFLRQYLDSIDEVMAELKPIAERIAKDNTIVVMTCNFGQAALLANFACSARARGLDVSNVLVFATDVETLELAEGLGLAAFYDEKNFKDLPSREARHYMDNIFAQMMYAKVVVVQVISMLGYDLIFQDVDIVWYRDPMVVFHNKTHPYYDYDVVFQDDGAHSPRYAPYSANSGFYFVRHNDKTRYLFTSFLYHGETVIVKKSHQQGLTVFLAEHSSLFGVKVKVIPLEDPDFPGGFHYHRRKQFMHDIADGKIVPRMFHMSWTANKNNKLLFMRQMGMWYFKDQCVDKKVPEIIVETGKDLIETCCSSEPLITCHYSDKPSIIPCKDSPPIDKGGRPFWK